MRRRAHGRFTLVIAGLLAVSGVRVLHAEWSPALAARYLDERQKAWFEWRPASSADGPCVSCHTGVPYLLARPALRKVLGEREPTFYERGLLGRLRAHVGEKPAGALQGVETIFAAAFLAREDDARTMSADTEKAFGQLWALQRRDTASKGAWTWYAANLDPWEHSGSTFFGASIAAHALGSTSPAYRDREDVRERTAALMAYLQTASPLTVHDRLALLWASATLPAVLSGPARKSLIEQVFAAQNADGGWTNEALGPWSPHPDAPVVAGSNSYATAFTAYALQRAGTASSNPGLARAVAWLASHQDPQTGAWRALSMNKPRPPESMEALFMQDAATAYASLALIEANR